MTFDRSHTFVGNISDILFNILPLIEPQTKWLELTLESKILVDPVGDSNV